MSDTNSTEQGQDVYFDMDHYLMDAFPDDMDHMNPDNQNDGGYGDGAPPANQAIQMNTFT